MKKKIARGASAAKLSQPSAPAAAPAPALPPRLGDLEEALARTRATIGAALDVLLVTSDNGFDCDTEGARFAVDVLLGLRSIEISVRDSIAEMKAEAANA